MILWPGSPWRHGPGLPNYVMVAAMPTLGRVWCGNHAQVVIFAGAYLVRPVPDISVERSTTVSKSEQGGGGGSGGGGQSGKSKGKGKGGGGSTSTPTPTPSTT